MNNLLKQLKKYGYLVLSLLLLLALSGLYGCVRNTPAATSPSQSQNYQIQDRTLQPSDKSETQNPDNSAISEEAPAEALSNEGEPDYIPASEAGPDDFPISEAASDDLPSGDVAQSDAAPDEDTTRETVLTDHAYETASSEASDSAEDTLSEDGKYYTKDDVALYLHLYGHLPSNYITKSEAQNMGWVSSKGNLWDVAPGMCIGGNRFGNYEKLLPEKKDRTYYECDVNYNGGYRDEERIIYSNDGLVYYTNDHYESFEQLY